MEESTLTIAEVSYIAGLFDGEGYVHCKRQTRKYSAKLIKTPGSKKDYKCWRIYCAIEMTDFTVLEWLHEILGFGALVGKKIRYSSEGKERKKTWVWSCSNREALKFAKLMWPYAIVKLHPLEKIIDHYEPQAQELGDNVVDLETERQMRENV